jgi:hypothetical protein
MLPRVLPFVESEVKRLETFEITVVGSESLSLRQFLPHPLEDKGQVAHLRELSSAHICLLGLSKTALFGIFSSFIVLKRLFSD